MRVSGLKVLFLPIEKPGWQMAEDRIETTRKSEPRTANDRERMADGRMTVQPSSLTQERSFTRCIVERLSAVTKISLHMLGHGEIAAS